MTNYKT